MGWPRGAYVGQKVACIDDSFGNYIQSGRYTIPVRLPMINEVLTVARIQLGGHPNSIIPGHPDKIYLGFQEFDIEQHDGPLSGTCLWCAECFKPLESASDKADRGLAALKDGIKTVREREGV